MVFVAEDISFIGNSGNIGATPKIGSNIGKFGGPCCSIEGQKHTKDFAKLGTGDGIFSAEGCVFIAMQDA